MPAKPAPFTPNPETPSRKRQRKKRRAERPRLRREIIAGIEMVGLETGDKGVVLHARMLGLGRIE
jgi:hypothetical protein